MNPKNIIYTMQDEKVISQFGTITTRGRELCERELEAYPTRKAFYNGIELRWVIGKYNDRLLDSDILPVSCRAWPYL